MRHCSVPKLQPQEKRIYLKFTEPEDLALYERLERDAKKQRYPLTVYALLVLLQAYPETGKDVAGQPETSQ